MANPDDLSPEQIESSLRHAAALVGAVDSDEDGPAPESGESPRSDVATSEKPESGSGVELFGGTLFRMEDYNVDLHNQAGVQIFERMYRGDPDVSSGLSRLTWPILAAEWEIEPAEDNDEEREIAEFCAKWIFGDGRTDPFAMNRQDFLRHALLMLPMGVSAFEKVWGTDHEGRDVYARLVPILPKTIEEFQFNDELGGQLQYLKQRAWILGKGFDVAKVPAEKLILFVFGREGDNMFGWPLCRAAYKPWLHKEKIEIIDGIRIERNGIGFFVITVPAGSKDKVRDAAKKVAKSMRVHEKQGIIVETGTTVEILYPSGSDPKIVESLQFLRSQILQVLVSEFVEHGQGNVGSKALVGSKIDFLLMCLQGVTTGMCHVIDRQAIPDLVERNWGKRKKLPRAKCDQISKMSIESAAEWISKLVACGALSLSPEIDQYLRQNGKLPLIPEKDLKRLRDIHDAKMDMELKLAKNPPIQPAIPGAAPAGANAEAPQNGNGNGNGSNPSEKVQEKNRIRDKLKAEGIARITERIFEGQDRADPLWRDRHMLTASGDPHPETFSAFESMKGYLQSEPKRVWVTTVAPLRDGMANIAAQRLVRMADGELGRKSIIPPRLRDKLIQNLEPSFLEVYRKGRKSVLEERDRQIPELPKEAGISDLTKATRAQLQWIKTRAAGFVLGMIQGMEKRGLDEALVVRQAELPEPEQITRIARAIQNLSDASLKAELAGDIGTAFATGREEQADAMEGEISTAYYSAIMDEGTQECEDRGGTCSLLDGMEHEPGDPDFQTPNPNCAWPPYCRCVRVYVFKRNEGESEELAASRRLEGR